MDFLFVKWTKGGKPGEIVFTDFSGEYEYIRLWNNKELTVLEVLELENKVCGLVDNSDSIAIINYKKYCDYFGLAKSGMVYDCQHNDDNLLRLVKEVKEIRDDVGLKWQEIRANASEVYHRLEKRGVLVNGIRKFPKYHMDVFSGRSKTTGFNVQGTNNDLEVSHPNQELNLIVRIDWMAADMKMASYLSKDEELIKSFELSDPYSYIVDALGGEIERNKCKLALNRAVNALIDNDLVFKIYPGLGDWMSSQRSRLENGKSVETILGRKFVSDGTIKNNRRSFNGILQGSVAHAMQSVISRIEESCGDIILTDQHDSLTIAVSESRLLKTIKKCSEIMLNPFGDDIRMPLTVEIGKKWCTYKKFKEFR